MRLIDADAFDENSDNLPEYWKDIVDDQPTVEAIPVSFIKEELYYMQLIIDNALNDGEVSSALTWLTRRTALITILERWKEGNKE